MLSPESMLHQPTGKLQMPKMPGIGGMGEQNQPNPFSGIRRAGQAKRAQNFAKYGQKNLSPSNLNTGSGPGGGGNFGSGSNTQFGAMGKQNLKFS